MGLEDKTLNYIVAEETKMEEIKIKAIKRAVRFEKKARESTKRLVKTCREKIEKKRKRRKVVGRKVEGRSGKKRRKCSEG